MPTKFSQFTSVFKESPIGRALLTALDEEFREIRALIKNLTSGTKKGRVLSLHEPVKVADPGLTPIGTLVNYRGATVQPATNASELANFAVGDIQDGKLLLYAGWHFGLLRIDSGRGTNADAELYLSTGGSATDDPNDITDANGSLQPGVNIGQLLGERLDASGTPPSGYIYCTLRLGDAFARN